MKRIFAVMAAAVLALSMAACGGNAEEQESSVSVSSAAEDLRAEDVEKIKGQLVGTWVVYDYVPSDNVSALLDYFSFTEDEIAFADLSGMGVACTVKFTEDGKYSYAYDKEETVKSVKAYYDGFITKLYENAGKLTAVYGEDVLNRCADLETFRAFYAYMFDKETYDDMLSAMAADSLDYDAMGGPLEEGRYTISLDGTLAMTADGSSQTYTVAYEFGDESLKLTYADGEETYIRAE